MRRILLAVLAALGAHVLTAQGAPPHRRYRAQQSRPEWGHQQEFLQLFLKNHYPLLQKNVESGRMLSVSLETPANHTTEDGRWDYRVTIRFKNSTLATTANPDEERLIRQLWPDQAQRVGLQHTVVFGGLESHAGLGVHDVASAWIDQVQALLALQLRPRTDTLQPGEVVRTQVEYAQADLRNGGHKHHCHTDQHQCLKPGKATCRLMRMPERPPKRRMIRANDAEGHWQYLA